MIDLGRVSMGRFTKRYLLFSLPGLLAAYFWSFRLSDSPEFFTGVITAMFLDFSFMETRMLVIQNPANLAVIARLGAKKAHVQLAITTFRFIFYTMLLLFAVVLGYTHRFFFGFFIAYFMDISILVLASYRKQD